MLVHEPPALRRVLPERVVPLEQRVIEAELHRCSLHRRLQFADEVAPRPGIHTVPRAAKGLVGVLVRPEAETVMMFARQDDVACTGLRKQLRPRRGIEVLRLEQIAELVVTEVRAIHARVIIRNCRRLRVAVAGTGLVLKPVLVPFLVRSHRRPRRHGVRPPMDEDAELRIPEPLRNGPRVERFPRRLVFLSRGGGKDGNA